MKFKLLKFLKKNKSLDYGKKLNTYNEARNLSKNSGIYFDNRTLKFEGPENVELTDRFYIASFLPTLINKKKPVIIDIGGGPNPIYSYIKKATNISCKSIVLDTKKLVNIINRKIPNKYKSEIKYISSLDKLNLKNIDILYFNSSIQYLEDYEKMIVKLFKLNPKYILISYTPFHNKKKNFYSIQYGVPGSVHPIIFFSMHKFIRLMKKAKYKDVFINKYKIKINKRITSSFNNFYYGDILFKK